MSRPFVKEVEFNTQGGGKFSLGAKTLIIGPNRIGKSSIVRAVELATTGRASDIAGRVTMALDAELWSLAPGGDPLDTITAKAIYSDGKEALWSLARGKKAKRTGPCAILPLRDVRAAILGSEETARKFFLSNIGGISWEDVMSEIPEEFHKPLERYRHPDGGAALLVALEATKKRARELRAEAKFARETAASLSQGLPPPPTPAAIEAATAGAARAAATANAAVARGHVARLDAEALVASARVEKAALRVKLAMEAAAQLAHERGASGASLPPIIEQAIAVAEHLAHSGATSCAVCGSQVMAGTFKTRVDRARAKIADALAIEKKRSAIEAERREAEFEHGSAVRDFERINADRARWRASIPPDDASEVSETPLENLLRLSEKWEAVKSGEGKAVTLDAEAAQVDQLSILCRTALDRLLGRSSRDFEKRVQAFLPSSWHFGIDLLDGDREVLRVGLRPAEDSAVRMALSGAEWATVTAAIASALVTTQSNVQAGEPVIIIPEDRDFDPSTLAQVMMSLAAFDGQVILTGTKRPDVMIDGWTIIDLGVEKAEKKAPTLTNYCAECKAEIITGECKHGVRGKPLMRPGDFSELFK